jgi:selenocysteine lyase/cysteine desulfurase
MVFGSTPQPQRIPMDLAACRQLFPIVNDQVFFNHAGIAPLSAPVAETAGDFYRECAAQAGAGYPRWQRRLAGARQSAATLLGAATEEIAFTGNTSMGLSLIAESFPWREGDAVLVPIPDFPANVYPWLHLQRRGVRVRYVERQQGRLTPEMIGAALRPDVRLLALSSVDYASGYAADLPAISALCRQRDVILAVDAIQSLGVLPLDVRSAGVQLLATGGHKWLCGPLGSGLLYVAADLPVELAPALVGWKSVIEPEDFRLHFELRTDAARFEPGTVNYGGIFGLGRAIELLLEVGIERGRERVFSLVDLLAAGLQERGLEIATSLAAGERSGILCFTPPGDAKALFQGLAGRQVTVALRDGRIRLAPHFYNDESDIERFFAALDALR